METQDLERKVNGSLLKRVARGISTGLLAGVLALGAGGCASQDRVEFRREIDPQTNKSVIDFEVEDRDGISKVYIVDENGNPVYDVGWEYLIRYADFLQTSRKISDICNMNEYPFLTTSYSGTRNWEKIEGRDYRTSGLDQGKEYMLVVEDNKGNVTMTPLEDRR